MGTERDHLDVVREFLSDCERAYVGSPDDIASWDNTVLTYTSHTAQLKYVHMYFAKYVGCCRAIRRAYDMVQDGPVWSVGAGPCLCLLGWFYDEPAGSEEDVVGVDILDWKGVRDLPSYKKLVQAVVGEGTDGGRRGYLAGRCFPPGEFPPQATRAAAWREHELHLRPLPAETIPVGTTVLLPFVLNHLLGGNDPTPKPQAVFDWLEEVRARAKRVLLVDIQAEESTAGFWACVREGLGVEREPLIFTFSQEVAHFGPAYSSDYAKRRTGVFSRKMVQATFLKGNHKGWRFIGDPVPAVTV